VALCCSPTTLAETPKDTELTVKATKGETVFSIGNDKKFETGMSVKVGDGELSEVRKITVIDTTDTFGDAINFKDPLVNAHTKGSKFAFYEVVDCDASDSASITKACKCASPHRNECKVGKFCWTGNTCHDVEKPVACEASDVNPITARCMCGAETANDCKSGKFCWKEGGCKETRKPYDVLASSDSSLGSSFSSSASLASSNSGSYHEGSSGSDFSGSTSSGSTASGSLGSFLEFWQWLLLLVLVCLICVCMKVAGGKKPKKKKSKKPSAPVEVEVPELAPLMMLPPLVPMQSTGFAMPMTASYAAPMTTSYAAPAQYAAAPQYAMPATTSYATAPAGYAQGGIV